jgi:hypothetical protein
MPGPRAVDIWMDKAITYLPAGGEPTPSCPPPEK